MSRTTCDVVLSHPGGRRAEQVSRREEPPDTLTLHRDCAQPRHTSRYSAINLCRTPIPAQLCQTLPCPRWNPHLSPSLPPPETSASIDVGGVSLDNPSEGRGLGLRTLGRAALPRSCGLHLGQVNYLMVDYALAEARPTRKPRRASDEAAPSRKESRPSARLKVFVNDPGRSGSPSLSVALDLWALIEMGG